VRTSTSRFGTAIVVASVALGACSSSATPVPTIQIENAVVRITMPTSPAAGYLVIVNNGATDDALTGASSPAFKSIELHETRVVDSGMSSSPMASSMPGMSTGSPMPSATMAGGDMMGMYPVSSIPVPAHGRQQLQTGGFHLMLMDPIGTISVGQTIQLTLTFQHAGVITVDATVQGV